MELGEREAHLHLPQSHCVGQNTKARTRATTGSQVASGAKDVPWGFPAPYLPASLLHRGEASPFLPTDGRRCHVDPKQVSLS